MTSDDALRDVRGVARAGRVRFTRHARQRASERAGGSGMGELHVLHALKNATACVATDSKWKATGPDLDGDELSVVLVLEARIIVVTVF